MVALQILVLPVQVRILGGQQKERPFLEGLFCVPVIKYYSPVFIK